MHSALTRKAILAAFALALVFGSAASADERPDHFEGKTAATVEDALTNLAQANTRIAELTGDGDLSPAEHAELHQLTYTAENALEKLSEAVENLQATLETVHLASERVDSETVLEQTPAYLEQSQRLFGGEPVPSGDSANRP